jgi:hypothetical protein
LACKYACRHTFLQPEHSTWLFTFLMHTFALEHAWSMSAFAPKPAPPTCSHARRPGISPPCELHPVAAKGSFFNHPNQDPRPCRVSPCATANRAHAYARARLSCHPFRPARSSPPRVSFWHTCARASMNLCSLLSARTHASEHASADTPASDAILPCLTLKQFDVLSEVDLCLDLDVAMSLPCFLYTTTR